MSDPTSSAELRPLTADERALVQWMLEHGFPDARGFLVQLPRVRVTPWRCECGCASINFVVEGLPDPQGPMQLLADFTFEALQGASGIFVFAQGGTLGGVEVVGYGGNAPATLPSPSVLKAIR
jgi:hypothetical protein